MLQEILEKMKQFEIDPSNFAKTLKHFNQFWEEQKELIKKLNHKMKRRHEALINEITLYANNVRSYIEEQLIEPQQDEQDCNTSESVLSEFLGIEPQGSTKEQGENDFSFVNNEMEVEEPATNNQNQATTNEPSQNAISNDQMVITENQAPNPNSDILQIDAQTEPPVARVDVTENIEQGNEHAITIVVQPTEEKMDVVEHSERVDDQEQSHDSQKQSIESISPPGQKGENAQMKENVVPVVQQISGQELKSSIQKAMNLNVSKIESQEQNIPTQFNIQKLDEYYEVMCNLMDVKKPLPNNPQSEDFEHIRKSLSDWIQFARAKNVSIAIFQPFVLRRYWKLMDDVTQQMWAVHAFKGNATIDLMREFFAMRQEILIHKWAKKTECKGAESASRVDDQGAVFLTDSPRFKKNVPPTSTMVSGNLKNRESGQYRAAMIERKPNQMRNFVPSRDSSAASGSSITSKKVQQKNPDRIKSCLMKECNSQTHTLHRCYLFLAKTLKDRLKYIDEHGICHLCLAAYHDKWDCFDDLCKNCEMPHNSRLCPHSELKRERLNKRMPQSGKFNQPPKNH